MYRPLRTYDEFTKLQKALVDLTGDETSFGKSILGMKLHKVCFVCGSSVKIRQLVKNNFEFIFNIKPIGHQLKVYIVTCQFTIQI